VKAGADNLILRAEGCAQNLLENATAPKSLHFKLVLAFNLFRTHGAAHGWIIMVVLGIGSGS